MNTNKHRFYLKLAADMLKGKISKNEVIKLFKTKTEYNYFIKNYYQPVQATNSLLQSIDMLSKIKYLANSVRKQELAKFKSVWKRTEKSINNLIRLAKKTGDLKYVNRAQFKLSESHMIYSKIKYLERVIEYTDMIKAKEEVFEAINKKFPGRFKKPNIGSSNAWEKNTLNYLNEMEENLKNENFNYMFLQILNIL